MAGRGEHRKPSLTALLLSVEFTISLLHDPDGTLLGPAAIIRDVTARWEEERALKKRLAALEAGTRGDAASSDPHPARVCH
jgi:hypothetical protein